MSVDFSQLAPPDIIETLDFESILAERKASLIEKFPANEKTQITETLDRESEPLTKFLQENAYREIVSTPLREHYYWPTPLKTI
mgnify:CR=1 FL=1